MGARHRPQRRARLRSILRDHLGADAPNRAGTRAYGNLRTQRQQPDRAARKFETLADHQRKSRISTALGIVSYVATRASLVRSKRPLRYRIGPSDGIHRGLLIAAGARQVTAVEGRPENVVKLLAAKYAMGWDNLEILADNFQVPGRWASRRYDAVFGHGVFYDCVDPFYLFDQLTRISDTIFIGGWVASDGTRLSEWCSMRYVPHFLAGLTTRSICRDPEGIDDFFAGAGYDAIFREEVDAGPGFSGRFIHWVFRRN